MWYYNIVLRYVIGIHLTWYQLSTTTRRDLFIILYYITARNQRGRPSEIINA